MVLIPLLFVVFLFVPTVVTALVVGLMCAGAAYELLHNTGFITSNRVNVYAMVEPTLPVPITVILFIIFPRFI